LNVAASRVTTGNHPLYEELERQLAAFFGAQAALLVASGYVANLALAEALAGDFRHAYIDERSHSSLKTAMRLLGTKMGKLQRSDQLLIATDGMFAQDGELAPLERYIELLPRNGLLWLDDAHGAATLGKTGKGTAEVFRVKSAQLVRTITLSKAFGVFGGAILGPREICQRVIQRSALFMGQTPLPLPLVAAALASLRLLRTNKSLRPTLNDNTRFVKSRLQALGFSVPDNPSPIVTYVPQNDRVATSFRRTLMRQGIFPSWIRYPGGPKQGYFRFALSSEHSRPQLEALVDAFMRLRPRLPATQRNRRRANAAG
jgi:7-keto-8-aminopelargonate synthetase-like enzyme